MKYGIVIAAITVCVLLPACSGEDNASLISSARAASSAEPLYPPLAADAADGQVHEYY